MRLNESDVNNRLQPFFAPYEDSFQQAWLEILESDPQTLEEITPIAKRVRNRAIRECLRKKFKEQSLYAPIGRNEDETFTLESILPSPSDENGEANDRNNDFYERIIDFLIREYVSQRNENMALKRKEMDLKAERLRLREEALRFKRERYESWKHLMEEKGRQKDARLELRVELAREKLEFRKERLSLRAQEGKVTGSPPLPHPHGSIPKS